MKASVNSPGNSIELRGQAVPYRLVRSKTAQQLRIRVGVSGVEVIQPATRRDEESAAFLRANEDWLFAQLERAEQFRSVRKTHQLNESEILFRGKPTPLHVREDTDWQGANQVALQQGGIVILRGRRSRTPVAKSLENWLRKQARLEIEIYLGEVSRRMKCVPRRIYVMSQRTKWGNCSVKQNLSFNWRLIQAPEYVLRYIVTHEAVHLVVPDHSKKFWLTVQSFCPEAEKAKQWLHGQGEQLLSGANLRGVFQK